MIDSRAQAVAGCLGSETSDPHDPVPDLSRHREGRPEYLRFSAPTYLLGWLYERLVNRMPGLWRLRVLLIAELRKPTRSAP